MTSSASQPGAKKLFYGYYVVAACCAIQAVNLGGVFTYGVLFPELENEFGWSRTEISAGSSIAFIMMGGFAVIMGRAADIYGPRIVMTIAGLLYGIGYFMLGQMNALWQIYLFYGVLVGLALAAHDVGTLSTVARWFAKRRGFMTGVVKAGAGLGQSLVPFIMALLIAGPGWRFACAAFGITAVIILVGVSQILRRNPEVLGLQIDGVEKTGAPSATIDGNSASTSTEVGVTFKESLRSRALWQLCAAKFFDLFCLFTVIVHIVSYAVDNGMPRAEAAAILSVIGAMSILGRLLIGSAYDRVGARRALMICFAILATSLAWLNFADSAWALFVFAVLYGPAHGGLFTVTAPSVAEYFGTRAHGTIFGVVVAFGTLGATFGPVVAGAFYDAFGSYEMAFAILFCSSVLGLVIASTLPRLQHP